MATAMNATIEEGILQEAINFALAKTNSTHIKLKEEQKEAVHQVVNGRDVIAVLPTGFGKSLIYHLLPTYSTILIRKEEIFLPCGQNQL
jgi:superfamily II DNA or RNA helicase